MKGFLQLFFMYFSNARLRPLLNSLLLHGCAFTSFSVFLVLLILAQLFKHFSVPRLFLMICWHCQFWIHPFIFKDVMSSAIHYILLIMFLFIILPLLLFFSLLFFSFLLLFFAINFLKFLLHLPSKSPSVPWLYTKQMWFSFFVTILQPNFWTCLC